MDLLMPLILEDWKLTIITTDGYLCHLTWIKMRFLSQAVMPSLDLIVRWYWISKCDTKISFKVACKGVVLGQTALNFLFNVMFIQHIVPSQRAGKDNRELILCRELRAINCFCHSPVVLNFLTLGTWGSSLMLMKYYSDGEVCINSYL